jgi:tRNA (Thr-GGU) A37 N-methylase
MKPIDLVKRKGSQVFLQILKPYRLGLKTILDFSHIWILWWMHQLESERCQLQIVPNFPRAPQDGVGIFLTRSSTTLIESGFPLDILWTVRSPTEELRLKE